MLVLISVKTGLYLGTWANVVVDLRVEISLHDIFLVVPIVCACPAAWGIGNLHQAPAVEEEPCLSGIGSMSPSAVELVEEEASGLYLGPWADAVIDLRVEIAPHDILLVVPIVCACPTAGGIGDLHHLRRSRRSRVHPWWAGSSQER